MRRSGCVVLAWFIALLMGTASGARAVPSISSTTAVARSTDSAAAEPRVAPPPSPPDDDGATSTSLPVGVTPEDAGPDFVTATSTGGWTVSLRSQKVGSSLVLTATTNKPLDGSGMWVIIYETNRPHAIQYLTWCSTGTTCVQADYVPHTTAGKYVAVVAPVLANSYHQIVPSVVASSSTVCPPAWAVWIRNKVAHTNYNVLKFGTQIVLYDSGRTWAPLRPYGWVEICGGGSGVTERTTCAAPAGTVWRGRPEASVKPTANWPCQGTYLVSTCSPADAAGGEDDLAPRVGCQAGDPVDCRAGGLVERFTDVRVHSRGPGLQWVRTYSSARASVDGPLGFGWSFSYDARLRVDGDARVFRDGSAHETRFERDCCDGSFSAPTQTRGVLVRRGTGYELQRRTDGLTWVFDAAGRLVALRNRSGLATTLSYDEAGRLVQVTDDVGRSLTVRWDGGKIIAVSDPMGRTTAYGFDGNGNQRSVADAARHLTRMDYDDGHLLTRAVDPRGAETSNTYTDDKVTRQVTPRGTTTFAYAGDFASAQGSTTTITDTHGVVTRQRYALGVLAAVTRAVGTPQEATWSKTWDLASHLPVRTTDPLGNVVSSEVDARGNISSVTDASGRTVSFTHDEMNHVTSQTLPSGRRVVLDYQDESGTLTDQLRAVTTQAKNSDGSFRDLATTRYEYTDPSHPTDRTAAVDPDGRRTGFTYDRFGALETVTIEGRGAPARTSLASHNIVGQVTCSVSPGRYAAGVRCDPDTPRAMGTSWAEYDERGLLSASADSLGRAASFMRDEVGNVTQTTGPDASVTRDSYDLTGRVTATTSAWGSATPETTTVSYDLPPGSAGCPGTGAAWCTKRSVRGQETLTEFDALGNVQAQTLPGGLRTTWTFDKAGRPATEKSPSGATTRTTLDPTGRVLSVARSTGSPATVRYSYTADGQRASMEEDGANGEVTRTRYVYGDDGLLARVSESSGPPAEQTEHWALAYGRNSSGDVTSLTYPSGRVVTRSYDAVGEMDGVTDDRRQAPVALGYDADTNLSSQGVPGGNVRTAYDADGGVSALELTDSAGQTSLALRYARDDTGRVSSETGDGPVVPGGAYAYTPNHRLASAGSTSFTYDALGNPLTLGSTVQTFDPASGRLATSDMGGVQRSFTYNANGDRAASSGRGGASYSYDQDSHLVASRVTAEPGGSSVTTTYAYDGDGVRRSKTTGGKTTRFVYDKSGSLPLLLSDGTYEYIYGPNGLAVEQVRISDGARFSFVHDQHGDTRALVDEAGKTVATWSYTPYGEVTQTSGTVTTPLLYGLGHYDDETGFVYLLARYYDPSTAQFLTVDPVYGLTGSLYGYVGEDPLNLTDPAGLCPSCFVFIGGAIGGGLFDLGMQALGNLFSGCSPFENIDWGSVGISALVGGLFSGGFALGFRGIGALAGLGKAAKTGTGLADDAARAALGGCFVTGTSVLLADGSSRAVEQVKVGDFVSSFDPGRGVIEQRRVIQTYVHHDVPTFDVSLATGERVTTTSEHPFWVEGRGWTPATKLVAGDRLRQPDGATVSVRSVVATGLTATVYNFEVQGLHNYYVRAGKTWILVHNNSAQLQLLHPVETIKGPAGSYGYWSKQSTDSIVKSLSTGREALTVDSAGKVWQGNTRILVLQERGYPVNNLPRVPKASDTSMFPDLG